MKIFLILACAVFCVFIFDFVLAADPPSGNPDPTPFKPISDYWTIQKKDGPFWINTNGKEAVGFVIQTGLAGIGTNDPKTLLDINGGLRLKPTTTIASPPVGAIYYDEASKRFQFCGNSNCAKAGDYNKLPDGTDPFWATQAISTINNKTAIFPRLASAPNLDIAKKLAIGEMPFANLQLFVAGSLLSIGNAESPPLFYDPPVCGSSPCFAWVRGSTKGYLKTGVNGGPYGQFSATFGYNGRPQGQGSFVAGGNNNQSSQNIAQGIASFVFGLSTQIPAASGQNSVAMGQSLRIDSQNSFAAGYQNIIYSGANAAAAFGYQSAIGGTAMYGISIGNGATCGSQGASAFGQGSRAMGRNSTAMGGSLAGYNLIAQSAYSVSMGQGPQAGVSGVAQSSVCMGYKSGCNSNYSVGMGYQVVNYGQSSVAMGNIPSTANGFIGGVSMGNGPSSASFHTTAMGYGSLANVSGAVAMGGGDSLGDKPMATKQYSVAIGRSAQANGDFSGAFGGPSNSVSGRSAVILGSAGNNASPYSLKIGNGVMLNPNGGSYLNGGNVGVQIPAPQAKLHVNGRAQFDGPVTVSRIQANSLCLNGSMPPCVSDWTFFSSRQYKENISTIENALRKVLVLQGVSFNWKKEYGGQNDVGLIAEDMQKIIPELAVLKNNIPEAVKYKQAYAVLIEAVKEQQKILDNNRNIIEEQKNAIARLSEKIKILKIKK